MIIYQNILIDIHTYSAYTPSEHLHIIGRTLFKCEHRKVTRCTVVFLNVTQFHAFKSPHFIRPYLNLHI